MTQTSRSSLNDIARHLGVSAMTVSRVVNNSGRVHPDTRQRIEAALRELGFRKDRFASINARKRGSRPGPWSVVVDGAVEAEGELDSFDFYARVVLVAIRALEAAGCQVVLTDLVREPGMRMSDVAEADAILFCSPVPEAVRRQVAGINPRAIVATAFERHPGASCVAPDDAGGGAMAAELAARNGHLRAAVVTAAHASYRARTAAFVSRLRELSPSAAVEVLEYPLQSDGIHSDQTAMRRLLAGRCAEGRLPTLFFAVGGFATLVLYRILRERGVAVPDEVSLIGFDALPFYDHLDIPVTRIEFAVAAIGARMADEALRRLRGEDDDGGPATIVLPCRYVEGRSFRDASAMRPAGTAAHAP